MGNRIAVAPLIDALNDENNEVRDFAAVSLGRLKDKRAVKPLLALLRNMDGEESSTTAFSLELSDQDVKASAIMALGSLGDKKAIKPIFKFLASKNRNLIEAAVLALGELRAKIATEPILRILNNHDKTNFARHFAAMALGKIGDKRAFDPLIAALSGDDVVIRIAAADGLGYFGDSHAVPALKLARKNDNGSDEFGRRVRDHATRAIRHIQRLTEKNE
jgi:HEAT repeat protein